MTRRVITTAVTVSWPASRSAGWPVQAAWPAGTVMEVAAGSALETAIGLANTRLVTDADVASPHGKATGN
jgi:hypothetical protein